MKVTIYHNPRCSKSRQTLALLRERGVDAESIEYLKTPPDKATLTGLLEALAMPASDLIRSGEPEYRALGLAGEETTESRLLDAMVDNPKLIQRPIVICGGQARLGRPPEKVLEIIPE